MVDPREWKQLDLPGRIDVLLALWRETPDPLVTNFLFDLQSVAADLVDKTAAEQELARGRCPRAEAITVIEDYVRGAREASEALDRVSQLDAIGRDPRLTDLLVSFLRKPIVGPTAGARDVKSWMALDIRLFDMVTAMEDPRAVDEVRTVPDRNPRKWSEGHVFVANKQHLAFNQRLRAFVEAERTPAPQLPKAERQRLMKLYGQWRTDKRYGPGGADAKELLSTIRKNPKDNGARLVYADVLSAAGDPRGEYIVLAVAAAEKTLDKAGKARMRELFDAHRAEWLRDVLPAIRLRKADMDRGFLTRCRIVRSDLKTLQKVADSMGFQLVRHVDLHNPSTCRSCVSWRCRR